MKSEEERNLVWVGVGLKRNWDVMHTHAYFRSPKAFQSHTKTAVLYLPLISSLAYGDTKETGCSHISGLIQQVTQVS